jgi:alanyl-tRNA synthetase
MMTSTQIRQSFVDFFKSKQHTIVPSSSLLPDSPNLLFTNAGMNQFVPIFLGQVKCPYTPGRAADTQKCIRAGGKHNDLDDVGLDTYHHTFFEMLGNWSFGDYFKKDAITWAWELVVEVWKFPPQRLYATIYHPDRSKGDPAERDDEAWNLWAGKFRSVGLDPDIHIVDGSKKDNFWMMGETGPCGPCTEVHVDLRPGPRETDLETQKSGRALVNGSDARCIEIWNNVFIQYNANPDGTFTPLPAQHVDTGMGFERVTSIIQGTKGLTDFANAKISNYETDIFRPIFDAIENLSGRKYGSTLPKPGSTGDTEQEKIDVAFRVIADHIRTLSFAIADGIQPGNTDRNYVLRRILRRAVRYGRSLGFHEPFFYKLVDVLAHTMGDVFPEIRAKRNYVEEVIQREEEAFNKTLDRGIDLFQKEDGANVTLQVMILAKPAYPKTDSPRYMHGADMVDSWRNTYPQYDEHLMFLLKRATGMSDEVLDQLRKRTATRSAGEVVTSLRDVPDNAEKWKTLEWLLFNSVSGRKAFELYDTYGFPLDLTELMARERGWVVDVATFDRLMQKQREQSQASQKKTVIELSQIETTTPTKFVGYDQKQVDVRILEVVQVKDKTAVITDQSVCYAEMGGQVGDTGMLLSDGRFWQITDTRKNGNAWLHFIEPQEGDTRRALPLAGHPGQVFYEGNRRNAIQRHHTVTHLLHWALHEVVSKDASQKGSFVGPDKLTFDFNSAPLTPGQVADIEKLVNERIVENTGVSWTEVPYADVKSRKDVMQFFGDKYGDSVRVVQIGGRAQHLDGYSMELCGGTHTRATGEIGLFRIAGENAIAAGVRRIEAVAGLTAYDAMKLDRELIRTVAGKVNSPIHELEKKVESLLAHQKELERQIKSAQQREASSIATNLKGQASTVNGIPAIIYNLGTADGDLLQAVADALKGTFKGVIVLGGASNGAVSLVAAVSPEFTARVQAGKIIQTIAPIVGGKGGGKPDNARGGGKDPSQLAEAIVTAKSLLR